MIITNVELLGWAAGLFISLSTIPNIIHNLKGGADETTFERNCLQLTGNCLWALYGSLLGAWPILVLCGLNAFLTGLLVLQQLVKKLGLKRARATDAGDET